MQAHRLVITQKARRMVEKLQVAVHHVERALSMYMDCERKGREAVGESAHRLSMVGPGVVDPTASARREGLGAMKPAVVVPEEVQQHEFMVPQDRVKPRLFNQR